MKGNTMTVIRSWIINIDGVDFDATLWLDESDNTVDIEAVASVQSQHLYYPGSSLVPALVSIYTVPMDQWQSAFANAARNAIATA